MPLNDDCVFVFDLDDTLYAERDFVRSGFRAISLCFAVEDQGSILRQLESSYKSREADPIGRVLKETNSSLEKARLLRAYREHQPEIQLADEVLGLLEQLNNSGHRLGLLTDGRSITQRNKIEALGLSRWFEEIVISEEFGSGKPDPRNYQHFQSVWPGSSYAYVGDNISKDFVSPNQLGWTTIALLNQGQNIHPQRFESSPSEYQPQFVIQKLA